MCPIACNIFVISIKNLQTKNTSNLGVCPGGDCCHCGNDCSRRIFTTSRFVWQRWRKVGYQRWRKVGYLRWRKESYQQWRKVGYQQRRTSRLSSNSVRLHQLSVRCHHRWYTELHAYRKVSWTKIIVQEYQDQNSSNGLHSIVLHSKSVLC